MELRSFICVLKFLQFSKVLCNKFEFCSLFFFNMIDIINNNLIKIFIPQPLKLDLKHMYEQTGKWLLSSIRINE